VTATPPLRIQELSSLFLTNLPAEIPYLDLPVYPLDSTHPPHRQNRYQRSLGRLASPKNIPNVSKPCTFRTTRASDGPGQLGFSLMRLLSSYRQMHAEILPVIYRLSIFFGAWRPLLGGVSQPQSLHIQLWRRGLVLSATAPLTANR
jgi:hypothetical protein